MFDKVNGRKTIDIKKEKKVQTYLNRLRKF